jgi:hypothetical protein
MQSVEMLNVANKAFMLNVVMLGVVAPLQEAKLKCLREQRLQYLSV